MNRRRNVEIAMAACVVAACTIACAAPSRAAAAEAAESCAPADYWVVDTRCAPTCAGVERGMPRVRFSRLEHGCFRPGSLDELAAAVDPSMPTVFYIHGNAVEPHDATNAGWSLARYLGRGVAPYRLIVWSWPSEHIPGARLRGNVHTKWTRSELQGYYLAIVLDRLDPEAPISLAGHSFGARTILAALQGLATGRVAGRPLPARIHEERRPVRALLVAAGVDNLALLPNRSHGRALEQAEQMLVTVNPGDRVLRGLALFSTTGSAQLGVTGSRRLSSSSGQLEHLRVDGQIGRQHAWLSHLQAPRIATRFRRLLFFH